MIRPMDSPTEITVTAEEEGLRLDQMLARRLTALSRTQLKQQIGEGGVIVNGEKARPRYKVRHGDRVLVSTGPVAVQRLRPEAIPLDLVYEDATIVVINKPAGLVVHPGAGVKSGTLANAIAHHFLDPSNPVEGLRPGIVHRLDRGTSGLMVVAKTNAAWLSLARQFKSRTVTKRYTALVYGRPALTSGVIEAPIGRHPSRRTRMAVRPVGRGRAATTVYRVVEYLGPFTLLELSLKTGRTHQIRVHLAHEGLPVVGDATYGGAYISKIREVSLREKIARLGRPFLHACELVFTHPKSGKPVQFKSPLAPELADLIRTLRSQERQ